MSSIFLIAQRTGITICIFYGAPSAFLQLKNFVLLNYYEQFLDLEIWLWANLITKESL